ncbi:hypothetical protein ACFLQX_02330 [Bacteroidota bacterium]
METSNKHLEDISEIRQLMERSTKFLSLSGWSGVFAGLFALMGAVAAYIYLGAGEISYDNRFQLLEAERSLSPQIFLLINALAVLVLAVASALLFSYRKATKAGEKFWSPVLKRLLFSLMVPLSAGGILSLIMMWQNHLDLVAPLTLIFYGIALVNAGRFVNKELVILGLADIALGLAATIWQDMGLYFWATGFGLFHIIYGATLYFKYDRI